MTKTCSYEGCERKHYAHALCRGHYAQQREGKPLSPLRGYTHKSALADFEVAYYKYKTWGNTRLTPAQQVFYDKIAEVDAAYPPSQATDSVNFKDVLAVHLRVINGTEALTQTQWDLLYRLNNSPGHEPRDNTIVYI